MEYSLEDWYDGLIKITSEAGRIPTRIHLHTRWKDIFQNEFRGRFKLKTGMWTLGNIRVIFHDDYQPMRVAVDTVKGI